MEKISLENELKNNSYPGRGIIIGRSADGTKQLPHTLSWEEVRTVETVYLLQMVREFVHRHLILQN